MQNNTRNRLMSGALVCTLVAAMALPAGAALVKKTLEVDSGVAIYVNDKSLKPTDVKGNAVDAFVADGTTYLPVRALTDSVDQFVSWDGKTGTVHVGANTADVKDAAYLQQYFDVKPFSATVTRAEFDAALTTMGLKATTGTGDLTLAEAVKTAIGIAGMEQLALTYTGKADPAKATDRLAAYGVTGVSAEYAPYVAAALDCDLAFAGWNFAAPLTQAPATTLLMNALEIAGVGRNYLGMASDPDIYAKLQSSWATFGNFNNEKLSKLGADLVIAGASTGFNLKYDGYSADFLPEYTLQYGHSSITHAVQLIGLLNSEGIEAKVALEPKTSVFEYLTEWGDPTKSTPSPTYELKPIDGGRWLCYATEYDMMLEFDTLEGKNAFDKIIADYSKKWDTNTDKDGNPTEPLLAGAWWQPLYSSYVPMADATNFTLIKDNVVKDGPYSIHPFSTADGTAPIAKVVAEKASDLKVELVDLYVNKAFFNYLTGADHQ